MQTMEILSTLLGLTLLSGAISHATLIPPVQAKPQAALTATQKTRQSYLVSSESTVPILNCDSKNVGGTTSINCQVQPGTKKTKASVALAVGNKIVVFDVSRDPRLGDLIQIGRVNSSGAPSPSKAISSRYWVRASDLFFADLRESGLITSRE